MAAIVITAAKRTAIGAFMGSLKDVSAVDLGVAAISPILAGLVLEDIADVIVGNVLQAGQGMNPARQVALKAGLPVKTPGQTINRVCGSGLQAVVNAVQGLKSGDGKLYIAGGIESMSRAPFLLPQARAGNRFGHADMVDSILSEGLTDPQLNYAMGITAENVAAQMEHHARTAGLFFFRKSTSGRCRQNRGRLRRGADSGERAGPKGSHCVPAG